MEDLQNSLELERKRNVKLTEQMERLRQENYGQAQECKIVLSLSFFSFYIYPYMETAIVCVSNPIDKQFLILKDNFKSSSPNVLAFIILRCHICVN